PRRAASLRKGYAMKIAAAQINPTIGDISGNVEKILQYINRAKELGAGLVIFPELCLTGYPPRDLLERSSFIEQNINALGELAPKVKDISALVGFVEKNLSAEGKPLYNAAALLEGGEIAYVTFKSLLPTYDVFDESRYFEPAAGTAPLKIGGQKIALTICEDIWTDEMCGPRKYAKDPLAEMAKKKFQLILNMSASPWSIGKDTLREELMKKQAKTYNCPVICVNQVGGNDELVFDGNSLAVDGSGNVIAHAKPFEEDIILVDLDYGAGDQHNLKLTDADATYRALVLGTRDYAHKCGFKKAVVGLSGGIDSALVAVIAAEALGHDNVLGVSLPSQFTSDASKKDAQSLAQHVGIDFKTIPIQPIFDSFAAEIGKVISGRPGDLSEQNLQSRIRGTVLMSISNKQGHLLLSTGNKSELATGYTTLYGDMAGGLDVLADVPKTLVYRIAKEVVNSGRELIPANTIQRPPSAELRHNQRDSDDLPEYDVLDPILKLYIEEMKSPEDIVAAGHAKDAVDKVVALVEKSEYKRRQTPVGLRVTSKAFGTGRRLPIARKL
ncbi:MAG TPA: NAD+ synthase, partial [Planctomycetota bacterium]|nr:NAD+ synthase [Planctomycetota bacterium]